MLQLFCKSLLYWYIYGYFHAQLKHEMKSKRKLKLFLKYNRLRYAIKLIHISLNKIYYHLCLIIF